MNYLAHIYLSGVHPLAQIGGFTADAIKGRAYHNYPSPMASAIMRHRKIDAFTDGHPIVRKWIVQLRPLCGRHSPIVIDILFDYLLAIDFEKYTGRHLRPFALRFYLYLLLYYRYLPNRFKSFVFHFIFTSRLTRYRSHQGIEESLSIMVRYRELPIEPSAVTLFLQTHQSALQHDFYLFWNDLLLHFPCGTK